jgi:hypothetical protein
MKIIRGSGDGLSSVPLDLKGIVMSRVFRPFRVVLYVGTFALSLLLASTTAGASSPGEGLFPVQHWTGGTATTIGTPTGRALPVSDFQVVASGLNAPHGLSIGPDGNLYVAEAGDGLVAAACVTGTEAACVNNTGSIARITPGGTVSPVTSGLPSIGNPGNDPGGAGVADVAVLNGQVYGVIQNQNIDPTTGQQTYGTAGALLGDLVRAPISGGTATSVASFGPYEAVNNPDGGAGNGPGDPPIDSDPYGIVDYDGGLAIADAAANDVLFVNAAGQISTLAVLPLIPEPDGSGGTVMAQGVPTSLAVGPDGALYVGELGGAASNDAGDVNVYRIVPGHAPTVYASGLTMIGSIAFDQAGRLLVLEIDTAGIADPQPGGLPASGAVIRINKDGTQTTLASTGLLYPLGMAVAKDGSIYVTNYGILSPGNSPIPGTSGEVVRIADPAPASQLGANLGGYRLAASDGGVFNFGDFSFSGSLGGTVINKPVVGVASDPLGPGYWMVASDGGVFSFGAASFYGSLGGTHLNAPIVGIAPTPDGRGYWLVASDGGVFTFGDAAFFGSTGGRHLNAPIVGIAAAPDGGGYDLFAADGGVFTFGDAPFKGSMGGTHLNAPIVGGATTPSGSGYWLVASDGGVFTFGDAGFFGSNGGHHLNAPIVGISSTPDGGGYLLAASDGGVFTFGDAVFSGSLGSTSGHKPVVGIG